MHIYSGITENSVNRVYRYIKNLVTKVGQTADGYLLCMLFMYLYEYILCRSKLSLSGRDELVDEEASLTDIMLFVEDKQLYSIIDLLSKIRNNAVYGKKKLCLINIYKVTDDARFDRLLGLFGIDEELSSDIKTCAGVVRDSLMLRSKCHKDCKEKLEEARKGGMSVNAILGDLYKLYPMYFVINEFIYLIGNDYLT